MHDAFPSISMELFGIIIEPIGPVEPKFSNLDQAVDMGRRIAQTGIKIQAIKQGIETVLEGSETSGCSG